MSLENQISEQNVSWEVDGIEVQATLTRPAGKGPFPAVIFVAGSGPTDRNWNTPILPGSHGSGGLLAPALTERGFVTLRYDKRGSGPQVAENMKRLMGKISLQGHREEVAGGVDLLAGDREVDRSRIFALTNSEGCVHALTYQTQSPQHPFAGMVLTSAFARPTGVLARDQIAAQLTAVPGGDAMLAGYDAAIQEFMAGQPVSSADNLPEGLRQVVMAITQPANQPFARELWLFDPTTLLEKVKVPVLILIGKKDIQVDWQVDGPIFEAVAKNHPNIAVVYLENTNHVMKLEPKPKEQLNPAEVSATYSSEQVGLDPIAVETIVSWLEAHE